MGYQWDSVERDVYECEKRRVEEQKARERRRQREESERRYSREENSNVDNAREQILGKWFSTSAMSDEEILRKEYRALVKQYHPDENKEDTTIIMQQIQEERESIRRLMSGSM